MIRTKKPLESWQYWLVWLVPAFFFCFFWERAEEHFQIFGYFCLISIEKSCVLKKVKTLEILNLGFWYYVPFVVMLYIMYFVYFEWLIRFFWFDSIWSYIPYSADPENHTLTLSRSYSYTVRSDLAFAVGYQSAPEGDWGNVSVNTPIRMVLPWSPEGFKKNIKRKPFNAVL